MTNSVWNGVGNLKANLSAKLFPNDCISSLEDIISCEPMSARHTSVAN